MRLPIKLLIQDHSQILHLIRHLQFSTKKSRIIKTFNLSVIREQDHCCLVCVNRQTYLCTPGQPACHHIACLQTCIFAVKPHHQRSPAPDNVHYGAYEVDRLPPCLTTEGTVLLSVSIPDLRSIALNFNFNFNLFSKMT
jgi:hypothetical protein